MASLRIKENMTSFVFVGGIIRDEFRNHANRSRAMFALTDMFEFLREQIRQLVYSQLFLRACLGVLVLMSLLQASLLLIS